MPGMRRLLFAAFLSTISFAALACTDDPSPSGTTVDIAPAEVIFREPEGPISVGAGTQFKVLYPSNPSTGYEWTVDVPAGANVTLVGDGPVYEHGSSDAEGSGGTDTFTFQAGSPGTATLTFVYSFQGQGAEERGGDERTVTVTVE